MARTDAPLFDTNVLIDVATADPQWFAWSEGQYARAATTSGIAINPIIYAELAPAYPDEATLRKWLNPRIFHLLPLPYKAAWSASVAYLRYRRAGGQKASPLPDFFIGAHAEAEGRTLVTRDPSHYRKYFPNVRLISPPDRGPAEA